MVLLKKKEWLAYTVALNDMLDGYDEVIARFEESSIPLDEVFGSNTEQTKPRPVILSFGPAVEPGNLGAILELLGEFGPDFLLLDEEGFPHKKQITIGSYNLDEEEAAPLTDDLREQIMTPGLGLEGLHQLYRNADRVPIIQVGR